MSDDEAAQREKERKALQKVRGLVDQAQAEERSVNKVDRSWALHAVLAVAGVAVLGVVVFSFLAWRQADERKAQQAQREAAKAARAGEPPMPAKFGQRHAHLGQVVEPLYAGYVTDCFARLEKRANSMNRSAVAGVQGTAQVTIEIRSDGYIQDVQVGSVTGNAGVEPNARRIIRLSEPCGIFPLAVQQVADYLHIKGTVQIDGSSADKVFAFVGDKPGVPR